MVFKKKKSAGPYGSCDDKLYALSWAMSGTEKPSETARSPLKLLVYARDETYITAFKIYIGRKSNLCLNFTKNYSTKKERLKYISMGLIYPNVSNCAIFWRRFQIFNLAACLCQLGAAERRIPSH